MSSADDYLAGEYVPDDDDSERRHESIADEFLANAETQPETSTIGGQPVPTSVEQFGRLVGAAMSVLVLLCLCAAIAAGAIWASVWAIRWLWF